MQEQENTKEGHSLEAVVRAHYAQPIHTELVCEEDGTIEDTVVETYYAPLERIAVAAGWLRVFADNDATDIETRIPFEMLERLGWKRPDAERPNAKLTHSAALSGAIETTTKEQEKHGYKKDK